MTKDITPTETETTTTEPVKEPTEETTTSTEEEVTTDKVEETKEETTPVKPEDVTPELYNSVVEQLKTTSEELEKFKHFNRKLENEKRDLKSLISKTQIADEFNLTKDALDLITGKTPEEQKTQAEKLAQLLTTKQEPLQPNLLQGIGTSTVVVDDEAETVRARLAARYNKPKTN